MLALTTGKGCGNDGLCISYGIIQKINTKRIKKHFQLLGDMQQAVGMHVAMVVSKHVAMAVDMYVAMAVVMYDVMVVSLPVVMAVGRYVAMAVSKHVAMTVGMYVTMAVGKHIAMAVGLYVVMVVSMHVTMGAVTSSGFMLTSISWLLCLVCHAVVFPVSLYKPFIPYPCKVQNPPHIILCF